MENTAVKKRGPAAMFALCPPAHVIALLGGFVVALFLALRHNEPLMRLLSARCVQPLHRALARLTAPLPFSLAEWLYALVLGGTLVYIIFELVALLLRPDRPRRLYCLFMRLLALGLGVYALFCLLWGVTYYGDDFMAQSGLEAGEISVRDLELVTGYFADRLNAYAPQVARDEAGLCRTDRAAVLAKSAGIYRNLEALYPFLAGLEIPAKPMFFSRALSIMDFSGFFCPFTGEANVNTDFPEALFAGTVAHELAHQRGVAKEQEANFVAVLACLESGDLDYCYSACLLAYIHLANALASASPEAYQQIYSGLSPEIRADLTENNRYWAQFETPARAVSTSVYEGFLQSYEQKLGLKSYGACVDLLVNRYAGEARAKLSK